MQSELKTAEQQGRKYLVPAVLKAFDIIEFISERGQASLTDIYKELHLPKTSAYQIINTLQDRGYLLYSTDKGTYSLSFRFLSLGNRVLVGLDLRDEAQPILQRLMSDVRQTCHLAVLEGFDAVYLAKAFYDGSAVINSWVGKRLNLQTTAMGRILLAWRKPEQVLDLLHRNPPIQRTPESILDPLKFMETLPLVRERGWAEENGENVVGLRCLAAPVRNVSGRVVAAMGISGLSAEITDQAIPDLSMKLLRAADELSRRLGYMQE